MSEQDHDSLSERKSGSVEEGDEVFVLGDAWPVGNRGKGQLEMGPCLIACTKLPMTMTSHIRGRGREAAAFGFARPTGVTGGGSGCGYEA